VVVVAGIFIFANSKDSNPERAESPSAPTNPSNSDDYVDVDVDVDAYAPEVEYSSWDDYPYYFRSNYLDACSNGTYSNYDLCLCTLEVMEETYTWEEAQEIDYAATQGEDISWLYDGLIATCT
jgi:hypothetical protein